MPVIRFAAVAAGALLIALSGCDAPPPPPAAVAAAAPAAPVTQSGGFASMLNAQRATAGLPPAVADPRLAAAAQAHAQDMVSRDYFSHTNPEGASSADRVRAAGFTACRAAENIAFGQNSEAAALQTWIGSPPHLANIMLPGSVQFGLGNAGNKWVLVFASPC